VRQSRSVHTALIRAQNMPSSSTLQRPPWYSDVLPLPLLSHPPAHACDSLIWLLSLTRWFPVQHTLTFFLSFPLFQQNRPFSWLS
jgi:hypothetical protein